MKQSSKQEKNRFGELKYLELAKAITDLTAQPTFRLYGKLGKCVATFTPDAFYVVLKPSLFPAKLELHSQDMVVEEYKGSKDMWAYKRADYAVKRRWFIVDYPQYIFIENVGGKLQKPKVRFPK